MMMAQITERQARALAALVAELRDDWDAQGVYAALGKARARGSAEDVCHAAIRAALTPTNRTPAVIAMAGDHWAAAPNSEPSTTTVVPAPHEPRCDRPGHEYYRLPCKGCRAEQIAADPTDDPPVLGITPEQAARNARWAAQAKAALTREGVGTGAGEGAPRQGTGSAWVTRSADCPEAPAQAHPLPPTDPTPRTPDARELAAGTDRED